MCQNKFLAMAPTVTVTPNRHALRVPPCKYNSFESADDTARSSTSCSPCPSSVSLIMLKTVF